MGGLIWGISLTTTSLKPRLSLLLACSRCSCGTAHVRSAKESGNKSIRTDSLSGDIIGAIILNLKLLGYFWNSKDGGRSRTGE